MSFKQTNAIISYDSPDGESLNWKYEPVLVRTDLNPDEVLVEIESVGICHTDIRMGLQGSKIVGHEGVGTIKKLGTPNSIHSVGDHIILSYAFCNDCYSCNHDNPEYCDSSVIKNLINTDKDDITFQNTSNHIKVDGKFMGQSSFAQLTIVDITSIVNIEHLRLNPSTLRYLGPFGCGFQTGAGAILKAGGLKPDESVIIYGFGGVGTAALLASKIGGASQIIVVDIKESRLQLAKELGATHTINPINVNLHDEIWRITQNRGVDLSLESIGGAQFVEEAIRNASSKGKIVTVGLVQANDQININLFDLLFKGKQIIGCIEGNSTAVEFIPKMIDWFVKGQFSIERIVKFYRVEEYETALKEMSDGTVIKPILLF